MRPWNKKGSDGNERMQRDRRENIMMMITMRNETKERYG